MPRASIPKAVHECSWNMTHCARTDLPGVQNSWGLLWMFNDVHPPPIFSIYWSSFPLKLSFLLGISLTSIFQTHRQIRSKWISSSPFYDCRVEAKGTHHFFRCISRCISRYEFKEKPMTLIFVRDQTNGLTKTLDQKRSKPKISGIAKKIHHLGLPAGRGKVRTGGGEGSKGARRSRCIFLLSL